MNLSSLPMAGAVSPSSVTPARTLQFTLNGQQVEIIDDGGSLLDALRDRLGFRSVKDGCAPQGQCGCCTVLVDGSARVACVTPLARVSGRVVATVEGIPAAGAWADAFCATGASQCGFCTPGIIARLATAGPTADVGKAMLAHLCRCTGWQTIAEAAALVAGGQTVTVRPRSAAADQRASLEGGTPQRIDTDSVLGQGGFADDTAPADALVAIRNGAGEWVVAESVHEARQLAGKVQGRRTTVSASWPIDLPDPPSADGWARTLQTTWVEPAYLEPDASWCAPGGEPASALANGGAFGGKRSGELGLVAQRLADVHGRAVRVLASREDVVRFGPKRPPMAIGMNVDGTGVAVVARTAGIAAAINAAAPGLVVHEVDVAGPPTSADLRAAGWAEAAVLLASLHDGKRDQIVAPDGAVAEAVVNDDGSIEIWVRCGDPLDEVVLRSYCIGAAHQALGWVTSEAIAVDEAGEPADLTIRSFGIIRAVDMPHVTVHIEPENSPPVRGSDAVFAAVAAAAWRRRNFAPAWPTDRT
jgi:xanthine dehydrogenase small subunit